MSTETIRLIRDGEKVVKRLWRWGKRESICLLLHCHHQNDSCIKMGSDESHSNVSLIVRDKVTRQCPQTTTFEEKGEPEQIQTKVPLLTNLTARPNQLTCRQVYFLPMAVFCSTCGSALLLDIFQPAAVYYYLKCFWPIAVHFYFRCIL